MSLVHSKNAVGLLQTASKEITALIKFFRFGGTGGSRPLAVKGRDIADALRAQGEVLIEFRAYMQNTDAFFMGTQAFIEGFPLTFSAIELTKARRSNKQVINKEGLRSKVLFRAFGFLDDYEVLADVGEFILIRGVLRAKEVVIGKTLLP